MPLVPTNIMTSGGDQKTTDWQNKLVGKTLSESTSDSTSFSKKELPKETRIIESGSMVTQDFKPDRLNVHLAKDGTVQHVDYK